MDDGHMNFNLETDLDSDDRVVQDTCHVTQEVPDVESQSDNSPDENTQYDITPDVHTQDDNTPDVETQDDNTPDVDTQDVTTPDVDMLDDSSQEKSDDLDQDYVPGVDDLVPDDSDSESVQPSTSRDRPTTRLSLRGKRKQSVYSESPKTTRFGPLVDTDEVESLKASAVPKNTSKDTAWTVKVFSDWRNARNTETRKYGIKKDKWALVPELSHDIETKLLDYWMQRFIIEAKRRDGTPYPALTVKHLCVGIQRFLREKMNRPDISFFDGIEFHGLRRALDGQMKILNKTGLKIHPKQAQPIKRDHESLFWEKGIFSMDDARSLQSAVYFYTSKVFGLRAADEHSSLMVEQFSFGSDDQGQFIRYQGFVKTTRGD